MEAPDHSHSAVKKTKNIFLVVLRVLDCAQERKYRVWENSYWCWVLYQPSFLHLLAKRKLLINDTSLWEEASGSIRSFSKNFILFYFFLYIWHWQNIWKANVMENKTKNKKKTLLKFEGSERVPWSLLCHSCVYNEQRLLVSLFGGDSSGPDRRWPREMEPPPPPPSARNTGTPNICFKSGTRSWGVVGFSICRVASSSL